MTENLTVPAPGDSGEFILFQTEDGQTRIEVRLAHDTIWLPQRLIADFFYVSVKTANEHLVNVYDERELDPAATLRKFRIVQIEGNREVSRTVDHYNLDAILAVGYRVRSLRGTQFRIWVQKTVFEGVPAQITSPARTVADCFRFERLVGPETAMEAFQDALQQRKVTIAELSHIAAVLPSRRLSAALDLRSL